ncbi:hypothetical protein [Brevundimonas sp. PWP3-1b1]|uniref:hypothetical protein n=1 Tax=unclassified Brevundimonas TaxID=2622653 RepID=UPI003CEF0AB5
MISNESIGAHGQHGVVRQRWTPGCDVRKEHFADMADVCLPGGAAGLAQGLPPSPFRLHTALGKLDRGDGEAIKRVSLISGEKSRSVKMTIADEVLTLTVRNMEAGVAAEEIEVRGEGPSFETGFNAKYLLDLLDQTDADQMLFRVTDPGSPARLDPGPGAKNAEGLVNIVMPVRV